MFEGLPGFRSFLPEDCSRRNHIFRVWRQAASRFGFQEFDAPVLEPLELFTEKSGPEIVDQLFHFVDKGGRAVALRPELTPSLARLAGARANSLRRPAKWFNVGEHFRYEKPQKGRLRSFYQFNCDILGEPGLGADAELVALAAHSFQAFGLRPEDVVIRLSDRDLWMYFLRARGLSEEAARQVLSVVDKMERDPEEATLERLRKVEGVGEMASRLLDRIRSLVSARTMAEVEQAVEGGALLGAEGRDPVKGRLEVWRQLLQRIEALGVGSWVRIDFSIVRGLAYYTGFVFEAFERGGTGRALAGGGRYDNLVAKLGYPDLSAVGFAMGDVTLGDLLTEKGLLSVKPGGPEVFIVSTGAAVSQALGLARDLRDRGLRVEYSLREQPFSRQFKAADQSGARWAIILGEEEQKTASARLKDMRSGQEEVHPLALIGAIVRDQVSPP